MKIEIDTKNPDALAAMVAMVGHRDVTTLPAMKRALERTFYLVPSEPLNLGTVVRDADDVVWIKTWMDDDTNWTRVTGTADTSDWADLEHPVRVISPGIADAEWAQA